MEYGDGKMDITCVAVLLLTMATNILKLIANFSFGSIAVSDVPHKDFSYESWSSLDPDYLKMTCESRSSRRILHAIVSLSSSISGYALYVPIFQLCWIFSRGGKRTTVNHLSIFFLALSGGLSELMASLMLTGFRTVAHAFSESDEISNWGSRDWALTVDGESYRSDDGIGLRALEIIYLMSAGLTTWVDAFEYICIFGIFVILYFEIMTELTSYRSWSRIGLAIGIINLFEFFAEIMRLKSWSFWSNAAVFLGDISSWILIPCWLIILGKGLPKIRVSILNQDENTPLTPSAPAVTGLGVLDPEEEVHTRSSTTGLNSFYNSE